MRMRRPVAIVPRATPINSPRAPATAGIWLINERKLFELRRNARLGQKAQLRQRITQLQDEIGGLNAQQEAKAREIYAAAGSEFNVNSPRQLGDVLFNRMGLPKPVRHGKGKIISTAQDVMEQLAEEHPIARWVLEYRQLTKLKSTYVDALPLLRDPATGRLHTTFNQAATATGRLSSTDPNLQNIPIRSELGKEIRAAFIAERGNVLLAADYSQIELRVLAHMSLDPVFVEAFRAGVDIYRQTASIVFNVAAGDVTSQMRAAAKTINFATIYGIGAFALAGKLGTSVAEAKSFIEEYFRRLPGVRRYLDEQVEKAKKNGFVETLSGRRRYIPELKSKNFSVRQFGERVATNAPVQGSAADIIKLAMIDIHTELQRRGLGGRMLLQVHDELVFEAPREEADRASGMIREIMERSYPLKVPLAVDIGMGETWAEAH